MPLLAANPNWQRPISGFLGCSIRTALSPFKHHPPASPNWRSSSLQFLDTPLGTPPRSNPASNMNKPPKISTPTLLLHSIASCTFQMIEVDIPRSMFEEQGRQLYGAKLLQIQANMKLNEQQLASLSSPRAVNEFLENNHENITNVIKQNLAVGDIFKRENLQFSTEELVKEVESSIAEFKRHKQDYDEERVKEQVQEILEGAKVLEWLRKHAEIQYATR